MHSCSGVDGVSHGLSIAFITLIEVVVGQSHSIVVVVVVVPTQWCWLEVC